MRALYTVAVITAITLISNILHAQTEVWRAIDSTLDLFSITTVINDGAGNSFTMGNATASDTFLVSKFNSNGIKQWTAKHAMTSGYIFDAVNDASGNTYYVGRTKPGSDDDAIIVKLNSLGTEQWFRIDNTSVSDDEYGSIVIDKDGNLIVGGSIVTAGNGSQLSVTKYSPTGVVLWAQHFGDNTNRPQTAKVIVDAQGNIFASAQCNTQIGIVTVKYNSAGILQWTQTIASPFSPSLSTPYSLKLDSHGNLYTLGSCDGGGKSYGINTKIKANGDAAWVKLTQNGTNNVRLHANAVSNDNELFICGEDADTAFVAKLDTATGDVVWMTRQGSLATNGTQSFFGMQYENNSLYAAGSIAGIGTGNDMILVKFSVTGNVLWQKQYNGLQNSYDYGNGLTVFNNGDIIMYGNETYNASGDYGLALVKYHETLTGIFEMAADAPFTVEAYPNPTSKELQFTVDVTTAVHVTMSIYDLNGKQIATVFNQKMEAGKNTVQWNAEGLAKGTYLYEVATPAGKSTGKFVKF